MNDVAHAGEQTEQTIELPADKPSKKIAVLGTTPSRMEAPIGDESWEVWTIGPGGKDAHRWDRLFEIHTIWPPNFGEREDLEKGTSYLNDLSLVKPPQAIYSILPMPMAMEEWAAGHGKNNGWLKEHVTGDWASNVVINRDSLFERYGKTWFSSSISYAMALAIEERPTDIAVFGIDLESGEEYVSQYPGCRHLMDLARFIGINLHVPKGCGLMREPTPYPDRYETHMALMLERKVAWLEHMLGEQRVSYDETKMMVHRVEGALLKMRQIAATPMTPEEMQTQIEAGEKELVQYSKNEGQIAANMNHCQGELSALRFGQRMWVYGMIDPNYDLGLTAR